MDPSAQPCVRAWLDALPRETRVRLYLLLDEVCAGMDLSRHNQFGFLRLRAEFETSGELLGCTIEELRDAIGATLGDTSALRSERPQSPLERLRSRVSARGHPDFR
ncbi:MAG TPA: hypothetical protein VHG53_03585 [Candidatus Limnocylindria bacterium]|nr:hypothetical protein [Candidatus Limnocylindria bacterium]